MARAAAPSPPGPASPPGRGAQRHAGTASALWPGTTGFRSERCVSARSRAARSPRLDAFDVSYGFIVYVTADSCRACAPQSSCGEPRHRASQQLNDIFARVRLFIPAHRRTPQEPRRSSRDGTPTHASSWDSLVPYHSLGLRVSLGQASRTVHPTSNAEKGSRVHR